MTARRKLTEAELGVRRQLAFGVLHEIRAASFGRSPRRRSPWPVLASIAGWCTASLIMLGTIVVACSH